LIASAPSNKKEVHYPPCFIENKLSFFDPTYSGWLDSYTYLDWIRNPENIKITHETIKKIGYQNLIDNDFFAEWNSTDRPLKTRIDSLILTYHLDTISSKYYYEFWERRKSEKNETIVFEILKEIQNILMNEKVVIKENYLNDTLFNLIQMQLSEDSLNLETAKSNFNYLKEIGLHQSAYNLLFERYSYYEIDWNQDSLTKTLIQDTDCLCVTPWIQDDTK
jgi:hypothetical protein